MGDRCLAMASASDGRSGRVVLLPDPDAGPQVECRHQERPFCLDVGQPAQVEAATAQFLLDHPEHRFDQVFPFPGERFRLLARHPLPMGARLGMVQIDLQRPPLASIGGTATKVGTGATDDDQNYYSWKQKKISKNV